MKRRGFLAALVGVAAAPFALKVRFPDGEVLEEASPDWIPGPTTGRIDSYFQQSEPVGASAGDIWFDLSGNPAPILHRFDGRAWQRVV